MNEPLEGVFQSVGEIRGLFENRHRLMSVLAVIARGICAEVIRFETAIERLRPGFGRHFVRPLESLTEIRFEDTESDAAYYTDKLGAMVVNIAPIERFITKILDMVENASSRGGDPWLQGASPGYLMRLAIGLYLLHEIRHFSQGISHFEKVQLIRRVDPEMMMMGAFDLVADRDAAQAFAYLQAIHARELTVANYLDFFAQALFFMGMYGFPAFRMNKPHKLARALGLTMMLARIALAKESGQIETSHWGQLPLDTALLARISEDNATFALLAYSPELRLVVAETDVDPEQLCELRSGIESGRFQEVLERACVLLRTLKLC